MVCGHQKSFKPQRSRNRNFAVLFSLFNHKFRYFDYFYSFIVLRLLIFINIAGLMKQEHIVMNDNNVLQQES